MNFVILPSEGTMSIDNAALDVATRHLLPQPVEIVVWHGDSGSGFIEYNDRPRITRQTTRLEDYIAPVDAWIGAAVLAGLTLEQARRIKIDMVEAIYQNKRIAPYTFPGNGWLYDCADEAVAHMAATMAANGVYDRIEAQFELTWRIDAAFTSKVTEVNGNVEMNRLNATQVNTWSGNMAQNWAALSFTNKYVTPTGPGGSSGGIGATDPAWAAHTHPVYSSRQSYTQVFSNLIRATGSGCAHRMNYPDYASVAAGGNTTISWQPLSPAMLYPHPVLQFRDVLRGIIRRRVDLNQDRLRKKNEIMSVASIAAVIAYPVAAGWST